MELYLEVIEGPRKGEKFTAKEGLRIGRTGQDISLDDPKVSTFHAEINVNSRGFLVLVDKKSRNGLIVGGKPRDKTTLRVGKIIRIGNTVVEVKQRRTASPSIHEVETATQPKLKKVRKVARTGANNPDYEVTQIPGASPENPDGDAFSKVRTWHEVLHNQLKEFSKNVKNRKARLAAVSPVLLLKFIKGIQMDTEWTIGYGPRSVGPNSMEFPVYDKDAPEVCFEIIPDSRGPKFKTSYPGSVLLNDNSVEQMVLKDKDRISFGTVVIEVSFHK